jgi:hypothetical protein
VSPFELDFFSEASLDNKRLHRPFFIYTPFGYTSPGLAKTLQLYASQRVQVGPSFPDRSSKSILLVSLKNYRIFAMQASWLSRPSRSLFAPMKRISEFWSPTLFQPIM